MDFLLRFFGHSVFLERGVGIRGFGGFLPSAVALLVYMPANRKARPWIFFSRASAD